MSRRAEFIISACGPSEATVATAAICEMFF